MLLGQSFDKVLFSPETGSRRSLARQNLVSARRESKFSSHVYVLWFGRYCFRSPGLKEVAFDGSFLGCRLIHILTEQRLYLHKTEGIFLLDVPANLGLTLAREQDKDIKTAFFRLQRTIARSSLWDQMRISWTGLSFGPR